MRRRSNPITKPTSKEFVEHAINEFVDAKEALRKAARIYPERGFVAFAQEHRLDLDHAFDQIDSIVDKLETMYEALE